MILKIGGKLPSGVRLAEKEKKETSKEKKEARRESKKAAERCEDRCPADPWAYCAVLWCACAMSLVSSGYSLYRQHGLQDRLSLLEEQHAALRSAVLEPLQPAARLRRDLRTPRPHRQRSISDYGHCGCPPGQ
ncbi:hypothetical protein RR46_07354 [Papilio xuthus]|uniref:Uncharacterized protein n=1 Tax=Papilio xuthus TaxID=66420 RepID=A0A194PWA5_PAPXU|nr:hypothetical protein RR46_07354 [Papilio xuthus]